MTNPIHIMLVDDNEGDLYLIKEALEEENVTTQITTANDGSKAIALLKNKIEEKSDLPDLILLDINLPKKNGHEVLKFIKESMQLKHIPVIMLTTSSAEKDIVKSYENHANCFITKPSEADSFLKVVKSIEDFWVNTVGLQGK